MDVLSIVILLFSILGAADRILGNKLGIGQEFEKGFHLLGSMALSMIGMIVVSPLLADLLRPMFDFTADVLHLDPSIIPSSLFANDMGGAPLSVEVARDEAVGLFNALVVSSMMGCTISFTIPFALGMVKKDLHRELILGLLCGVVTVPLGCFFAGLTAGLPLPALLLDLLPLVLFAGVIAAGLLLCPNLCVKIFSVFGFLIKALITVGLVLGIAEFLLKKELIPSLESIEEGGLVCLNAAIVMTGMFPLISLLSRLLSKPLSWLGAKIGISELSAIGLVSSLATSMTTFGVMNDMDKKGVMLNSAFAVSAAFTFAGHLAFTMAFDASMLLPMIVGKLSAGALALVLAALLYRKLGRPQPSAEDARA